MSVENQGQCQVAEQPDPAVAGIGPGVAEVVDQERHHDGDRIGRHDATHPVPGVAPQRRRLPSTGGGPHPRTEQQVAGQREEDRHTDLHPRIHPAHEATSDTYPWCRRRGCRPPAGPRPRAPGQRRHPVNTSTASRPPWSTSRDAVIGPCPGLPAGGTRVVGRHAAVRLEVDQHAGDPGVLKGFQRGRRQLGGQLDQ